MTTAFFAFFGAIAVIAALLAMTSRHLIHAALWLIVALGAVAGCFVLLAAELLAWVQVLIYVGSIVVLIVFALMLTRSPTAPASAEVTANRWWAAVLGGAVTAGLAAVMVAGFGRERLEPERIGSAEAMGHAVFREWVLGFEILSVVLLAALVGAIVIARSGAER